MNNKREFYKITRQYFSLFSCDSRFWRLSQQELIDKAIEATTQMLLEGYCDKEDCRDFLKDDDFIFFSPCGHQVDRSAIEHALMLVETGLQSAPEGWRK